MGRLDGRVAFITGAARGQGRSHAIRVAEEGADVIAVDACGARPSSSPLPYDLPSVADLAATAAAVEALGRRIVTAVADVRDQAALSEAVAVGSRELGHVDIAVANAGILTVGPAQHLSEEQWIEMLDINLTGVWHTCRAVIPSLITQGTGGAIILASSVVGLKGTANAAHYVAAKHGVVGLTRALATELGEYSIRVNAVCPTQVDTPMTLNPAVFRLFCPGVPKPAEPDFRRASRALHALPVSFVTARDVSNAVLFLASDDSRLITGIVLPVDAGLLARLRCQPAARSHGICLRSSQPTSAAASRSSWSRSMQITSATAASRAPASRLAHFLTAPATPRNLAAPI
jgi:SDR family mycofactocin-dependent oxidoreductase